MITDYYKILGVKPEATLQEIKTSYRKLSKKFHPDLNQGDKFFEERFKEIQEAYEKLTDQAFKSTYDRQFKKGENEKGGDFKNSQTNNTQNRENSPFENSSVKQTKTTKSNGDFLIALAVAAFLLIIVWFMYSKDFRKANNDLLVSVDSVVIPFAEKADSQNIKDNNSLIKLDDSVVVASPKMTDSQNSTDNRSSLNDDLDNKGHKDYFLNVLPFSFKLGLTSEVDLINSGFIRENHYDNEAGDRLYKLNKVLYCYINKLTTKLSSVKIWVTPDDWEVHGIKIGMSEEELIKSFGKYEIKYRIDDNKYDDNIYVTFHNMEYWFCFPKNDDANSGELKDSLDFVVVKSVD